VRNTCAEYANSSDVIPSCYRTGRRELRDVDNCGVSASGRDRMSYTRNVIKSHG